ncbi:hypothetical protein B0O99DRAFT_627018 [Bisporella sp. PMI_857]|nr:hypothetical protein B0O99DRAFT_627018 [Bisporella sp. PMI_857]
MPRGGGKNKVEAKEKEVTSDVPLKYERHFWYHDKEDDDFEEIAWEADVCHWCQISGFPKQEEYPITITNDVDDFELPEDFRFIDEMILDDDVYPAEDAFRSGCECIGTKDCQFARCHCLQDMDFDDDTPDDAKVYSYYADGPNADCLREEKLDSRDPIYECHASCSCSLECPNRVVERGRKIPLNIFKTDDSRGWGVRSSARIKKGQFIDRYLGHIITSEEATARRADSEVAQRKDVYLFALDKFSDPDSMDPRLAGPPLEVDGEFMSGPTRFINHSCEPNLRIFARVGDHADKHIHDLAFFAIHDIEPGTELTFDYVDGGDADLVRDSKNVHKVKDMTKCLCGSKKCRGYLW